MTGLEVVIDTNVAVVANGKTQQAGLDCILKCIRTLQRIQNDGWVLLNDSSLILTEYRNNLHPSGQPGIGDAFFRWLFENQANPEHCRKVTVNLHSDRDFEEFPDDPDLMAFDRSDRKFVAVAHASGNEPDILNASDTDWWIHREGSRRHGIKAVFLCPELMTK